MCITSMLFFPTSRPLAVRIEPEQQVVSVLPHWSTQLTHYFPRVPLVIDAPPHFSSLLFSSLLFTHTADSAAWLELEEDGGVWLVSMQVTVLWHTPFTPNS